MNITQDGSHNQGSNLGVDAYMASNSNTFLYQSTVLLLLDTLDSVKLFVDNNKDKETNLAKWDKVQTVLKSTSLKGKVIKIAGNGWGTFKQDGNTLEIGIPPQMITSNKLILNQSIEITTEPSPDKTKTFIKDITV